MKKITMKLLLILFLLIIFTTGLPASAYSTDKITTVEGIIENVPDDTIVVRDRRYTIAGVLLLKPSGEQVSKEELTRGKKVRIFFQNKKINSVVVYENMVE